MTWQTAVVASGYSVLLVPQVVQWTFTRKLTILDDLDPGCSLAVLTVYSCFAVHAVYAVHAMHRSMWASFVAISVTVVAVISLVGLSLQVVDT